ncbi:Short-chain-enoyl-CoA hydratase [Bradyrhizobium ivorense]|uniref:Short-chain-enoyl-CoA hydratase n=1 Tax=Bradyrhizobium ivorense TaxID=2511166 RepID=A0A508T2N8_9BRAD|nr:enoyl-CoA hydratase [Bradyrhizobium ivorense]VIO69123.1 Short-chain-enoyl-CoA hydratase [Bradyrhizobium ivorense]
MKRTDTDLEMEHASIAWPSSDAAIVTIRNAGPLNILTSAVMNDLRLAIEEVGRAAKLRVLIVRGEGDEAFVAGADIYEMVDLDETSATPFITHLYALCEAVRHCPVPVIARLPGYCLGGGLQLAASCDIRMAAEEARFGMPEVRIGMASMVHSALLPRLTRQSEANWLLLTGEQISAQEALHSGLVTRVAPKMQLDSAIADVVAAIRRCGPESVREQKRLLRRWENQPLDEAISASIPLFAHAYSSGEPQRYLRKFIESRREVKKAAT